MRSSILWALLAVACGGAVAYVYETRGGGAPTAAAAPAPQAVPVTTVVAASTSFKVTLSGLGSVHAFNTVIVKSRVDGVVQKIAFKEGDMVRQGDLIAEIDPAPFQVALDSAEAKLAQDQAALANAQADLNRYATLAKQDFASRQQLDTQQALVRQDEAQIDVDKAAIANAQIQLGYTKITAPIAGRLGFRLVDEGNIVAAASQTGIVTIAQMQPISVVFTLPERNFDALRTAMANGAVPAKAISADGAHVLGTGEVSVLNNQIDSVTGTFQAKATFANENNALWPGEDVSVEVETDTLQGVVVLPQEAVQRGLQGPYVYVVGADSRAKIAPVKTGAANDQAIVVTSGVSAGDKVVVAGQYRLQDGALVAEAPGVATTQSGAL